MPQQYLMPCDCGVKITVTASQAGDQLVCECGKNLDVPSFTELRQLEPAAAPTDGPDHKRRNWSRVQALLFTCGLLTAVVASGGIGCMADLLSLLPLEALGVSGVIVGRALYDGRVDLAEAIAAVGETRLQDITSIAADLA